MIRSSAADQEWDVITADPRMVRYLKRQGWELKTDHQIPAPVSYKVPFRKLRIGRRRQN